MANKKLFNSGGVEMVTNPAGGKSVKLSDKEALAKFMVTSTLNDIYYTNAEDQLKSVNGLIDNITDLSFLAKCAVYAAENAKMKDTSAYLLSVIHKKDKKLFVKIFPRVISNGKMLRTFTQIMRSKGVNLSSRMIRKCYQQWFDSRSGEKVFNNSFGNDPSLVDILKMTHINPDKHQHLFRYLFGNEYDKTQLPQNLQEYLNWVEDRSNPVPKVDVKFLDSHKLTNEEWREVVKNCTWNTLRMNLATIIRNGVLDSKTRKLVCKRISEEVPKGVFPYQIYQAYRMNKDNLAIANALNEAMEKSVENLPQISGKTYIAIDVSGSMSSIFGNNNSTIQIREVAALFAACLSKRCDSSIIIKFDTRVHSDVMENSTNSILTMTQSLHCNGGGTNTSVVPFYLKDKKFNNLIMISDNCSWVDWNNSFSNEWNKICDKRKLVSIDLAPFAITNANTKAKNNLMVGGFNDSVFEVIGSFINTKKKFLSVINSIEV